MAAYIIANVQVTDPVAFADYGKQVPAIVAAHGGRYLVRGPGAEVLEGDVAPQRVVVIEFPDMASFGVAIALTANSVVEVDANWTGLNKMAAWADKLGNQPSAA